MSKYRQRGAYHFHEFADPWTVYAKHVDGLIEQLGRHIGEGVRITAFEVGCGEGLILNQLTLRLGWRVAGSDVDPYATNMARRLCPHAVIHCIGTPPQDLVDVALFCDSLEHIREPFEMLEWAQKAKWIVIAIPSEYDRHAVNEFHGAPDVFDKTLSVWGDIVHRETRNARHLTIWKRRA